MHMNAYCWTWFDSDTEAPPSGREHSHLSVVGGPMDGAGDGIKMGTSGLLCEAIFAIFEGENEAVNRGGPHFSLSERLVSVPQLSHM